MAEFLNECWELGIPKMRQKFALDVVNYFQCYNRNNPFRQILPGNNFVILLMVFIICKSVCPHM